MMKQQFRFLYVLFLCPSTEINFFPGFSSQNHVYPDFVTLGGALQLQCISILSITLYIVLLNEISHLAASLVYCSVGI